MDKSEVVRGNTFKDDFFREHYRRNPSSVPITINLLCKKNPKKLMVFWGFLVFVLDILGAGFRVFLSDGRDVVLVCFTLAKNQGIDLLKVMEEKMLFNEKRED